MTVEFTSGTLRVSLAGIVVSVVDANGGAEATFARNLEGLEEASALLGRWLELPSVHPARECRLIHERETLSAAIRDEAQKLLCEGMPGVQSVDPLADGPDEGV